MSRYSLKPAKKEHQGYEIVVGWDGMLGNFFSSVRKPRENDFALGAEVVDGLAKVRTTPPSISDFNRVINAISDYAVIDDDLRRKLWDDRRNEGNFGEMRTQAGSSLN